MRKIVFVAVLATLIARLAHADAECTDRPECWPVGSSMHTGLLLREHKLQTERRLASKHKELVELVATSVAGQLPDSRLIEALKTQQAAWLKYRSEECELIGSLTGTAATWPSTYATQCSANHTDLRLRRVRSAIRCIRKMPAEALPFERHQCLQQLAPLTNKM